MIRWCLRSCVWMWAVVLKDTVEDEREQTIVWLVLPNAAFNHGSTVRRGTFIISFLLVRG